MDDLLTMQRYVEEMSRKRDALVEETLRTCASVRENALLVLQQNTALAEENTLLKNRIIELEAIVNER